MRRGSGKPCPGCGEVVEWRPADQLCQACKVLLARARAMAAELSRKPDEVAVTFSSTPHLNKSIRVHGDSFAVRTGEQLRKALVTIALQMSRRDFGDAEVWFDLLGRTEYGYAAGGAYLMPRVMAEAVRDLRGLIATAIEQSYAAGRADGNNLLVRLAQGDLSPNDYLKESEQ